MLVRDDIELIAWLMAAAAGVWLLFSTRAARVGTTLTAPARWTGVALVLQAVCDGLLPWAAAGTSLGEALRYLVAVVTFCPEMALLGAKRPQNLAWQWIVLSLWGLLALPALESLIFRPGSLYVAPAWSWLLVILIVIEGLNHLPTRYWLSALLAMTGQLLLLSPHLPLLFWTPGVWQRLGGMVCFVLALGCVAFGLPKATRKSLPLDRVWIDFRNCYGTAWGLRVLQRLQETARNANWPATPTWQGFMLPPEEQELSPADETRIRQALESALWRFVDNRWLSARCSTFEERQ